MFQEDGLQLIVYSAYVSIGLIQLVIPNLCWFIDWNRLLRLVGPPSSVVLQWTSADGPFDDKAPRWHTHSQNTKFPMAAAVTVTPCCCPHSVYWELLCKSMATLYWVQIGFNMTLATLIGLADKPHATWTVSLPIALVWLSHRLVGYVGCWNQSSSQKEKTTWLTISIKWLMSLLLKLVYCMVLSPADLGFYQIVR